MNHSRDREVYGRASSETLGADGTAKKLVICMSMTQWLDAMACKSPLKSMTRTRLGGLFIRPYLEVGVRVRLKERCLQRQGAVHDRQ